MANRLSKIYTRTGDDGSTGMADGSRLSKDDLLVCSIGDVDELNSQLAVLACHAPDVFKEAIYAIQDALFNVGAELTVGQNMLDESHTVLLESALDVLNQSLEPLKEFILPGGGLAASQCHVARAVCRRVERTLVRLNRQCALNHSLLSYINRLSDYLFVLARAIGKHEGEKEVYWQSDRIKNNSTR